MNTQTATHHVCRNPLALGGLLLIALTASCGGKKNADLELAAARAALDDAAANLAKNCAKEIFMAAEVVVREAKELAESGDVEAAKAKAAEAESLANQARAASPPGCDKEEEEEEQVAVIPDREASASNDSSAAMNLADVLETIYFDYNQSFIREQSKAVLTKVAEILRGDGGLRIEVEGHCDTRGSTEYNLHLGERRARSVLKYLVTQGADPGQVEMISYGEERPVDLEESESAHQKNRRAELRRR